jgi:hypothetical protein
MEMKKVGIIALVILAVIVAYFAIQRQSERDNVKIQATASKAQPCQSNSQCHTGCCQNGKCEKCP